MDREKLWVALKVVRVPIHHVCCLQEATVRAEYGDKERFPVAKDVSICLICLQNISPKKLNETQKEE